MALTFKFSKSFYYVLNRDVPTPEETILLRSTLLFVPAGTEFVETENGLQPVTVETLSPNRRKLDTAKVFHGTLFPHCAWGPYSEATAIRGLWLVKKDAGGITLLAAGRPEIRNFPDPEPCPITAERHPAALGEAALLIQKTGPNFAIAPVEELAVPAEA